jgi:uncharacterized membrane protein YczE
VPQSQWGRPVRREWLFLGAMLIIGARISATFIGPGWLTAVFEALLSMAVSSVIGVVLLGVGMSVLTASRLVAIPVLAVVLGTIFEVQRRWGCFAAGPLVVVTFFLVYQALRSGILAPRPIQALPVLPTEASR